jgi:acetyl esterase/lipase
MKTGAHEPGTAPSLAFRVGLRLRLLAMPMRSKTWRSIAYGDKPGQELDIIRPRFELRRILPVAIVFHGGGWRKGSRDQTVGRVCRRYIEQGFLAVNVGYRCEGVVAASADARLALDWVIQHISQFNGDSEHLVVTGESAGGQLALLVASDMPVRMWAAVNFYAPTDLNASVAEAEYASLQPASAGDILRQLSPIHRVKPEMCPVLSIHCSGDPVVPIEHTLRLTSDLVKSGVHAEHMILEGDDHGFTEAQLESIYRRVFRFLEGVSTVDR